MWLPDMLVMPELIARLSGKISAPVMEQMLLLYEAYTTVVSDPDDFATFCSWSNVVLKDFQDIDQYLVDPAVLFGNLRNIEEIDHWSLNSEVLSGTQEKYLGFWNDIGRTHQKYLELREERDVWSYGALVRKLPEWKQQFEETLNGKTIWFTGLTALTPAEERLIFTLEEICSVKLCWDADAYYFNDPINEAGSYLRRFAKRKIAEIPLTSDMVLSPKRVEVIESATPSGEVFVLCEALKNLPPEAYSETAVVLADTGLIQLLIRALTDQQIPVQTSMGIPAKDLLPGQWLGILLQIKAPASGHKVHFRMFLEWLSLSTDLGLSREAFLKIRSEVINEVIVYPGIQQCRDLLERLAPEWSGRELLSSQSPREFLLLLRQFVLDYRDRNAGFALKSSAAQSIIRTLHELERVIELHPFANAMDVIRTLWLQLSSREEVRFDSVLREGIHVVSMVETRGLDFETLFIMGANEDRFPGTSQEQTFIPWDVRGLFQLPLPDVREATFAYNFYRLIQRPSNIHFLYSSINADFRASEPSRFIAQLEYEWPLRNKAVSWTKRVVRMESVVQESAPERMPNNAFSRKRLDELFAAGLSPSAIGKFNRCPLDFYYRYIIGLGEKEELEENISVATFGSVVHDVLENFYLEFIGKFPAPSDFEQLIETVEDRLKDALSRIYSANGLNTGLNLLSIHVAAEMLRGYLESEKQRAEKAKSENKPIALHDIEFWMERELPVQRFGWDKPIKLRGKGDRVEEVEGIHRIIDYKTGKVEPADYQLKNDISAVVQSKDAGKLLQLLTYIYMYAGKGQLPERISAGFFSFIKPSAGYCMLESGDNSATPNQWIPDFERAMVDWVKNVYELPHFEHDPRSNYCQYCQERSAFSAN